MTTAPYFHFTSAAERDRSYASIVSLAKDTGFDVSADENEHRIVMTGTKVKEAGTVNFSVTISRPNVRVKVFAFGRTAEGRTVHLKDAQAIRTFINSHHI